MKKIFLLSVAFAAPLLSQVSSGALSGAITDGSDRAVAGAQVVARRETTGFSRAATTGDSGEYLLDDLPPGTYSVSAEKEGFKKFVAAHAVIEVNQHARLDFQLVVGSAHDSITVAASITPIQSENSTVGYRIDSQTMNGLPLDQRNVTSLVTLGPGAIPRQLGGFVHDVDNDVQQGTRGSVALNPPVNGSRPYMNRYILDGAYDTDGNTFAIVVEPPMDSVQEFRISSSLASPVFNQSGGAVIDVVTKSGGSAFHGSAFEFFRNEATDARNFFDDPSLPRPIFRRNQYGGSVGGPLSHSTFFFVTYEGLYGEFAKSSLQLVPDQAFRGGDFTGDSVIYDPLTLNAAGQKTPFPANIIPPNRLDPIAQKYLAEFEPLPNRPNNPSSNYLDATPSTNNNNTGSARIDHDFHRGGVLFGRYTINDEIGGIGGNFPLRPTSELLRAQQVAIGHTLARTNWINDLRATFTRLRLFDLPLNAGGNDVAAELGISDTPTDPLAFGLPYFLVTDFSTVTDDPTLPQIQRDNTWGLSDTVVSTRGRHTWKFGADWVHFQFNYRQSNSIRGQYTYTGAFTENNSDPSTGDAFADFLLGLPQQTSRTVGASQAYLRQNDYGAFLQHDWQISRALTVNMGVRYEFFSPFTDARDQMLNLDYSSLPNPPTLVPVNQATEPNYKNFAPRAGVAWKLPSQIAGSRDTVFRAGYGVYFSPEIAVEAYDLTLNGLQNQLNTTDGNAPPVLTTQNGFPTTSTTGFPSYYGVDPHSPTPYVQQWNASLQRLFPGDVLFEVAYVGTKGTDIGLFRRFNTALHTETGEDLGPRPGDLQSLRTFPELGTLFQRQHIGNSSYNSLQLKAEKRFLKSLSFLASFVWAKSIDDANSEIVGLYDSAGAQDENNLRLERSLSFFDVPRRVSAAFVYAVPYPRFAKPVLSNWQFSGVLTFQDGTPLDPVYYSADFANTGTPNRPDVVPGQSVSLPASQRSGDRWFNTAAFQDPQPYTFGNAGRNTIPGPGNEVIDIALHRRFAISERLGLEVRGEVFNLLNHPNLGIPLSYPDFGSFFGKIFASGDPRRIQFAARIDF